MKPIAIFIFVILCVIQVSQAQVDPATIRAYSTWVLPIGRGPVIKGVLYQVKDSSVVISGSTGKIDYITGKFNAEEIWSKDIKEIQLRKKGAQGIAIAIGGISGALIGILVGASINTQGGPDELEDAFDVGKMVLFPLMCAGIGVGIGGMIGGVKIKLPVKGSQDRFNLSKDKMEARSIKKYLNEINFPEATFLKLNDTITDADGNVYHLLALGGQVWMAENLKTTHFRDGSEIPGVQKGIVNNGHRYIWTDISDHRNLCPAGWHVPTMAEWTSLFNSLGGESYAGIKMETGFLTEGKTGQWWSATETDEVQAKCLYLDNSTAGVMLTSVAKTSALPVRCIRD
jgi:hypothetical protein